MARVPFYTTGKMEAQWGIRPSPGGHLYYHGRHLHMVVLHANGATYWVVNTLLDSLSNETMLAIAKGLRPADT